ncbi:hypothetical protein A0257_14535 [Hymenobacter psoromatis]|nr:hypothetical protein A0257_14535 [Hymenobacter psoromatis]
MLRLLLGSLLLLATAAQAQIAPTSPARQRTDNRRALREARRTDLPYQDSHLDVTRRQLRRGSTAPGPRGAGEPRVDRRGRPRGREAGFLGLRRRARNEPKP